MNENYTRPTMSPRDRDKKPRATQRASEGESESERLWCLGVCCVGVCVKDERRASNNLRTTPLLWTL